MLIKTTKITGKVSRCLVRLLVISNPLNAMTASSILQCKLRYLTMEGVDGSTYEHLLAMLEVPDEVALRRRN